MATRVADIAEYLAARQRIYEEALAADKRRLAKVHGEGPVRDAQALLDKRATNPDQYHWDQDAHRRAVASGLQKVLIERALARQSDLSE